MDLEQNKDLYFVCKCGKKILKKNKTKHLKTLKHEYWRLKKEEIDRLGDWTDFNSDSNIFMDNPMNAAKS